MPKLFKCIDVYIVNETSFRFPSVKVLTGAFASDGDNLIVTGKSLRAPIEVLPHSAERIDGSDTGELDFVVWYMIDMFDEYDEERQFRFSLLKYRRQHKKVHLPLLDRMGYKIDLKHREGESIDEWIHVRDIKSCYFDYSKKTSFPDFR